MYIAGRLRTGSRPSSTSMCLAVYSSRGGGRAEAGRVGALIPLLISGRLPGGGRQRGRDDPDEAVALGDGLAAAGAGALDLAQADIAGLALLGLEGEAVAVAEREGRADQAVALGHVHHDHPPARAGEGRDLR